MGLKGSIETYINTCLTQLDILWGNRELWDIRKYSFYLYRYSVGEEGSIETYGNTRLTQLGILWG